MEDNEFMAVGEVQCDVCGERTFQQREGFYYCNECGTQRKQMRVVEVSAEDTFNDTNKFSSQRVIRKQQATENDDGGNEITSWEFYNYVLRGLMEELINMGAKPELKMMTLQLWAAYLEKTEVAFYKNNKLGLPKLNVRALRRDARIMYNHRTTKTKRKSRSKKNPTVAVDDERTSARKWRKTKRKLDETGYTTTDLVSESSKQSIRLQWSKHAQSSIKKTKSTKAALDKQSHVSMDVMHAGDGGGQYGDYLGPKLKTLNHFDRNIYCLNITKMYVILGLALNLIEDSIQLTDLVRFVDEDHLSHRYLLNYVPQNVAAQAKTLLKELQLNYINSYKCGYEKLRMHIAQMSRFIDLNGYQIPDLSALVERYVLELNLPSVLGKYVCSLMDVLPPTFKNVMSPHTFPCYEVRAMAYIIYAMKLLFGLDDNKELKISAAATEINKVLASKTDAPSPLFAFTEWMEFVEVRKVIVSHYNEKFAERFGQTTSTGRKVDDILNRERKEREQGHNCDDLLSQTLQRKRENFALIFETLFKNFFGASIAASAMENHIEFQPSLTPAHSYFKKILLHATQLDRTLDIKIPEFMMVDHSERQLEPFKNQTNELKQYLLAQRRGLRVEELQCEQVIDRVGLFQTFYTNRYKRQQYRANFDINTDVWLEELRRRERLPELRYSQPYSTYGRQYAEKMRQRANRRDALEKYNPFRMKRSVQCSYMLKLGEQEVALDELTAIQTFDEDNMEPLRVPLEGPRKRLERHSNDDDDDEIKEKEEPIVPELSQGGQLADDELLVLNISNFDCWFLHGYVTKMRQVDKSELRTLFPCSFLWLLDTCAATIGVPWILLYEQLMEIEILFHHGIKDMNKHTGCLKLKHHSMYKGINGLLKHFRDMW